MRIRPPHINTSTRFEEWQQRLIRELDLASYDPSQTAPEQIAVLALTELPRDHPWDAAALLTLACYRRHEQAYDAYRYGLTEGVEAAREHSRYIQPGAQRSFMRAYDRLVEEETRAFTEATFTHELDRLAAGLGAALQVETAREDMQRVVMGNIGDR